VIGRLRGILVERSSDLVLDVAGVGYVVSVTPRTLAALPGLGEEVVLHTHLHVREDTLGLFGFTANRELITFKLLLSASGVGTKVALAILATLTPEAVASAISMEDVTLLSTVQGIGKRTAQKIILELKPKFAATEAELPSGSSLAIVKEALQGLGYQGVEIAGVLSGLPDDEPVELQIRLALQALGKDRLR
jgi:Holliday junction DNA helicase RuvA